MGKSIRSIRIDSCCQIEMKNFDSVPQLKCFSYMHHCAARSHHGSHSRHCRRSLLLRQLAALLQCGPAGHGIGGLVQQLQDQSPEPLVWLLRGFWQSSESNRIESNRLVCGTESNRIVFFFTELPITTNQSDSDVSKQIITEQLSRGVILKTSGKHLELSSLRQILRECSHVYHLCGIA